MLHCVTRRQGSGIRGAKAASSIPGLQPTRSPFAKARQQGRVKAAPLSIRKTENILQVGGCEPLGVFHRCKNQPSGREAASSVVEDFAIDPLNGALDHP